MSDFSEHLQQEAAGLSWLKRQYVRFLLWLLKRASPAAADELDYWPPMPDETPAAGREPWPAVTDCPQCRQPDEYRNVGRVQWGVCKACGVRWRMGENVFSSWRDETPADWAEQERDLEAYKDITSAGAVSTIVDEVPYERE